MDKQPKEPFICIDPGINIGISGFLPATEFPVLTEAIINPGGDWNLTSQVVLYKYEYLIQKYAKTFKLCFIERPQFMEHGYAGKSAARSDSLVKLSAIWGCIVYITRKAGMQVIDVEIPRWKGQLGKIQINARIKRALKNEQDFPDHISDAIGIGLHLKGLL
jgi:hypothetical protein